MKVQLVSDLHFEHQKGANPKTRPWELITKTDADVLVLAGDIFSLHANDTWDYLTTFCDAYPQVIYVPGNHDYWGFPWESSEFKLQSFAGRRENLHVLCHATSYTVTIEGQRFIGDTMWVPNTPQAALTSTNDPRFIQGFKNIVWELHDRFRNFLVSELKRDDVLVTHYLPSYQSVAKQFQGSPTNCWFVGDIEDILSGVQPKAVLHGHSHSPATYNIGETRVLCNPSGYPSEVVVGYRKGLTIEV